MLGLAGVIAKAVNIASVTIRVVVAAGMFGNELTDAVITVEPVSIPVARPLALMVATAGSADDQVVKLVISDDVPSA